MNSDTYLKISDRILPTISSTIFYSNKPFIRLLNIDIRKKGPPWGSFLFYFITDDSKGGQERVRGRRRRFAARCFKCSDA